MSAPLIILASSADVASVKQAVERAGARAVDGWSLPTAPWDLSADRTVCCGVIGVATEARAALLAAVRGVGVIAAADETTALGQAFVDDLERVGPVQRPAVAVAPQLPADQRRLLELVAGGRSIPDAAAALFISVRTAERRMADVRRTLGVRTTAAAVHALATSGGDR